MPTSSKTTPDAFAAIRSNGATTTPCSVPECTEPGSYRVQFVARENIGSGKQRDRARVSGPPLCEAHAAAFMADLAPELRNIERAATEA